MGRTISPESTGALACALAVGLACAACNSARRAPATPRRDASTRDVVRPAATPRYAAEVVARFAHAPEAFTQGLEFYQGALYESTGLYGHSSLRVVDPATGVVSRRREVAQEHFAEGLTIFGRRVYQLTYQSHRCLVYDVDTLAPVAEFTYPGEGWGLTHDAHALIMSDGSDSLRFLDPNTFAELRRVQVREGSAVIDEINELEMVEGEIFANIWHSDHIARIDPASGRVVGWIDLPFSPASLGLTEPEAVLNGIAWEPASRRLFVTGKLWPVMFEIRLRPAVDAG